MKFLHLKAMDDKYGRPSLRIPTGQKIKPVTSYCRALKGYFCAKIHVGGDLRDNHVELFTLKIGKARRQLEGRNDFLTVSKCYGRLNFSAISLLRAQPPKTHVHGWDSLQFSISS